MSAPPRAHASRHSGDLVLREKAETLSASLPPLLIAATRVANAVVHGLHGRRRAGPGEDFWQYRPYSFGDSAHRIDWRKSARSDRVLIRENEWAATHTLYLWANRSPGMEFRSHLSGTSKHERAALLSLALAVLATRAGERVAGLGLPYPPGHTQLTLNRLAHTFAERPSEEAASLPAEQPLPRFAAAVLMGDFLEPLDRISQRLTTIAATGIAGHLVQVLDPAEETLPYQGRTEFIEFKGSQRFLAGKAELLRKDYQTRLHRHRDSLRELARRLGWSFTLHLTDRPPSQALLSLYGLLAGPRAVGARAAG
ncbi:MAG: DUF58 domain-containing protein [Parvibaculaceae bacterium]